MNNKNENEKSILRAAIDKAEKNGYKGHLRYLPIFVHTVDDKKASLEKLDKLANDVFYFHGREIIFSQGFITSFFPKNEVDEERNILKDYKYHTAKMYSENPIKYIEKYL